MLAMSVATRIQLHKRPILLLEALSAEKIHLVEAAAVVAGVLAGERTGTALNALRT
jgi:hypothetical protein